MKRLLSVVAVLALIAAACTGDGGASPTSTTLPPTTSTTTAATTTAPATTTTTTSPPVTSTTVPADWAIPASLQLGTFGSYRAVPLAISSTYPGPPLPASLDGVLVAESLARYIDMSGVREALLNHGFVIIPEENKHFWSIYEAAGYDLIPVFVTTDAAYHAWHLVFDKILREAEQVVFIPLLEDLLTELVVRARAQAAAYAGTDLGPAADRAAQFYEAAATVLELDVGPIGSLAQAEVALVREALQYTASPVTSFASCEAGSSSASCNDYSLYKPRGHYTRNADLERYFRAMSVLGNSAFFMDADSLRIGLMATRVLLSDPHLVELWRGIYEPTAFLVGAADDYTPFEAAAAAADVTPDGLSAPFDFVDPLVVDEVAKSLLGAREIQINPNAPSVRIMGVRFVLDSYIYDQLVHPGVPQRFEASPLDLAAAFGSGFALDLQRNEQTRFPEYRPRMEAMRAVVDGRSPADWGHTVYDAWLYALEPMFQPRAEESTDVRVRTTAFPEFMRSEAWTAKAHQTAFGSYTELKHDTILYAKQAIAEGGGDPNPYRHWVEPEPVVYDRLAAAAELLRSGLVDRGLFPEGVDAYSETYTELLGYLIEWLDRLGDIAAAELRGEPISAEDNAFLEETGTRLESIWMRTSDWEYGDDSGPDDMAALVADVMRGPEQILHLATGWVDRILVLTPDDSGRYQLATGGVYSYYEFWRSEGDRLSDEEWRGLLTSGGAPARPSWHSVFLP